MSFFPVSNSQLSAARLALFLESAYGLAGPVGCRILKAGINDTYAVSHASGNGVFRVYSFNWRSETEIREELNLLNILRHQGIPVSHPIADAQGNLVQTFDAPEGKRFGVMFTHAAGTKQHSFPADLHFKIGKLMASMHRVTQNLKLDRITYTPQILLEDSFKRLQQFLSTDTDEMRFMAHTQRYLIAELANANLSQLRHGAVHLDIWFDNLNITASGDVTLFDFDFCGNGWLCLDIAYYILQTHSLERDETSCNEKVKAFLNGYESITPISDEEKRLLPALGVTMYFFYLGVQCRRYDNWSNMFLNEAYLKRYIVANVKRFVELKKLPIEIV